MKHVLFPSPTLSGFEGLLCAPRITGWHRRDSNALDLTIAGPDGARIELSVTFEPFAPGKLLALVTAFTAWSANGARRIELGTSAESLTPVSRLLHPVTTECHEALRALLGLPPVILRWRMLTQVSGEAGRSA